MAKKPSLPVEVTEVTQVTMQGVEGFFAKVVTKFGTGAKIDCPKRYLGREVFVVIRGPPAREFATEEPILERGVARGSETEDRSDLRLRGDLGLAASSPVAGGASPYLSPGASQPIAEAMSVGAPPARARGERRGRSSALEYVTRGSSPS